MNKIDSKTLSAFFSFMSHITAAIAEHSAMEFRSFLVISRNAFPTFVPLIESCIEITSKAAKEVKRTNSRNYVEFKEEWLECPISPEKSSVNTGMHLFDLLRSKQLFPTNQDLSDFASRVLPGMIRMRFDKMSRTDIAGRIIDYIETQDVVKRQRLEESMKKAIMDVSAGSKPEPQTWFSQWENIIKGI